MNPATALSQDWPMPDAAAWLEASTTTLTDERGEFHLEPLRDAAEQPSVVWVTSPGLRARAIHLAIGESPNHIAGAIELSAGGILTASVRSANGSPVVGAEVFQRLYLSARDRASMSADDARAAYALQRRFLTDADGMAILHDLGARECLTASAGNEASQGWIGAAPDRVELSLFSTFTWEARITSEDPELVFVHPTVVLVGVSGATRTLLDSASVSAGGMVRPRRSALFPNDSLQFELEGAGIPSTIHRPCPNSGDHVEVNFVARSGVRYPVRVAQKDDTPIGGAEVRWAWSEGEHWQWATKFSDDSGFAALEHAPLGASWLVVNKSGFIGYQSELVLVGPFSPALPVILERGATLRGRVLADGAPVQTFTIVHRPVDLVEGSRFFDVVDSKDGSFALEGLPVGERAVFAVATNRPRCSEQIISLSIEREAEANFELLPGTQGSGTVRDALTGEPIVGATIQLWTSSGRLRTREWGRKSESDAAGRFKVDGLAPTEATILEVRATDHALAYRTVLGVSSREVDIGVIALPRARALTVQLRLLPSESASAWSVRLPDAPDPRSVTFPDSGTLTFGGLIPAVYEVILSKEVDSSRSLAVEVPLDSDASVLFDLTDGLDFDVEVVAKGTPLDLSECWLIVRSTFTAYEQGRVQQIRLPPSGIAHVHAVQGTSVYLAVVDGSGQGMGSGIPSMDELRTGTFVLRLGAEDRCLRVLDSKRGPWPGVLVNLGSPKLVWLGARTTDSAGQICFKGFAEDTFDVCLRRPPSGGGILRDIRLGETPLEIVFDPRSSLSVRLLDGETPLAGVSIWVRDGFGLDREFETLVTDEAGFARGAGYLPQVFRGITHQAGIWPATFTLQASESATPTVVQVRRRGSVVLHAKRGGLALAGVALAIESEEFATTIPTWIASGAITSSDGGCVTDAQGRLRLDGLPRGPYRWSITLDDGVQVGGRFEVEPQRRVDVDLSLP